MKTLRRRKSWPALATGVAAAEAVSALRPFSKHEDVMIVGHEPQLSAVASIMLAGART